MKLNAGAVGVDDTRPPDLQVREYGWATLELNDVAYIPLSNPKGDIHALVTPGTSNPDESARVKERYRYTDYGLPIIEPIAFSGTYSANLSVSYSSGTDQTTITDSNANNGDWDVLDTSLVDSTMHADIFGDVADFPILAVGVGQTTTTVTVAGDARAAAIADYWEIEDTRALKITAAPTTTGTGAATLTVLTLDAIPTRDGSKSGTAAEDNDLVGQMVTLDLDTLATAVIVKNDKTAQKLYLRGDWTGLLSVDKYIKVHPRESTIGNTSLFVGESGYVYDGGSVTIGTDYYRLPTFYYVHNRYYAPDQGRFIQRDPAGLWHDALELGNGYGYGGSSPATLADPSGLNVYAEKLGDRARKR